VWVLPNEYYDRNKTFSLHFLHNRPPISLFRNTMVSEIRRVCTLKMSLLETVLKKVCSVDTTRYSYLADIGCWGARALKMVAAGGCSEGPEMPYQGRMSFRETISSGCLISGSIPSVPASNAWIWCSKVCKGAWKNPLYVNDVR
jgi:hypothetical protein